MPAAVRAGVADPVFSSIVEEGEREIGLKFGSDRLRDGGGHARQLWLSAGCGTTSWWFTELAVGWKQEPGEGRRLDALEWENRDQLTETGRHPVDLGLLVEIERPQDRSDGRVDSIAVTSLLSAKKFGARRQRRHLGSDARAGTWW
jgi:hypothetical protein